MVDDNLELVQTLLGFDMYVGPEADGGLDYAVRHHGVYEAGTLHVMERVLREGDVFMDIGANIGLMSLAASKFVGEGGTVYSFEPVPSTYRILRRNIEINNVMNVKTYSKAVGSKREEKNIYWMYGGKSGAATMIEPQKDTYYCKVEVETVDGFVRDNDINVLRLIKIDVEGWELEVLKGAKELLSSDKAPVVIIEYSETHPIFGGELMDIYDNLVRINDYKIYRLEGGKENISPFYEIGPLELPKHDNLFCFLPVHDMERINVGGKNG